MDNVPHSLTRLGFTIDRKKSGPQPGQQVEYLGVVLDLVSLCPFCWNPDQVLRLQQGTAITAFTVMLFELMVARHPVGPLELLHMCCLHLDPKSQKHRMVNIPP